MPATAVVVGASYQRSAERSAERRAADPSIDWVRPGPYKAPPARRAVGRPRKSTALTIFYGYPAGLIAEWCAVKLSTAHAYKSGRLKPGASVVKLFKLHAQRLVLTEDWAGWLVKPDAIVDPEGNETNRNLLLINQ